MSIKKVMREPGTLIESVLFFNESSETHTERMKKRKSNHSHHTGLVCVCLCDTNEAIWNYSSRGSIPCELRMNE